MALLITWTQSAKLFASDGEAEDRFGNSVSFIDNRVLVGAKYGTGQHTGSAYVFEFDAMFWNQSTKLNANDGFFADRFGYSVSLSGKFALIGAPYDDVKGGDSGSAYLFQYDGTRWIQKSKLVQPDGKTNNRFGYSVSQSDVGALIGVYRDDDRGTDSGSALVYRNALDLIYFGGFDE